MSPDIQIVHFARREVHLTDGRTVPITNFIGPDGEDVDSPDEAVTFVAGEGSTWFSERMSDFEAARIN